jgi:PAS domain S-box-containing protein
LTSRESVEDWSEIDAEPSTSNRTYTPHELVEASARLLDILERVGTAEQDVPGSVLTEARRCANALWSAGHELEAAERRAMLEAQRWASLFEAAPDGYLVTDQSGCVSESNHAARQLLGVPAGHLRGESLVDFVVEQHKKTFKSALSKVSERNVVDEFTLSVRSREGVECNVVVRVALLNTDSAQILWSLRDVSEQYWNRQRVKGLEHNLQLLNDITLLHRFLADEHTIDEAVQEIASLAERMAPGSDIVIILNSTETGNESKLELRYCANEHVASVARTLMGAGRGPFFDALKSRQMVHTTNLASDERWPGLLVPPVSVLSFPLEHHGDVFGTICFYGSEKADTPIDLEVAKVLARQSAVLVDNVRSYNDSRLATANLERAMATRSIIEQAKGMIMLSKHVDENTAFDLLRKLSQAENRKLNEIAADVVARLSSGAKSTS